MSIYLSIRLILGILFVSDTFKDGTNITLIWNLTLISILIEIFNLPLLILKIIILEDFAPTSRPPCLLIPLQDLKNLSLIYIILIVSTVNRAEAVKCSFNGLLAAFIKLINFDSWLLRDIFKIDLLGLSHDIFLHPSIGISWQEHLHDLRSGLWIKKKILEPNISGMNICSHARLKNLFEKSQVCLLQQLVQVWSLKIKDFIGLLNWAQLVDVQSFIQETIAEVEQERYILAHSNQL